MAFPAVAVVVGPVDEVRVMVRCEKEWIVVRARGAGLPRLWRDRDEIESTWGWVKREVRLVRLVRSASWAAGKIAHGDVCMVARQGKVFGVCFALGWLSACIRGSL